VTRALARLGAPSLHIPTPVPP